MLQYFRIFGAQLVAGAYEKLKAVFPEGQHVNIGSYGDQDFLVAGYGLVPAQLESIRSLGFEAKWGEGPTPTCCGQPMAGRIVGIFPSTAFTCGRCGRES